MAEVVAPRPATSVALNPCAILRPAGGAAETVVTTQAGAAAP